ncbi:MAG: sigma-70 family RNA polymerase sigma factor [Bacteroidales bacterium]|nr:sigma-70 family RNA polymerase sigma factor [Bacteroidales bacterium]
MSTTDKEALFRALVDRQRDLIWHVCRDYCAVLSDSWQIEDAFQEVLCAIWRDLEKFEGRSAEGTWVYRVATNTMRDLLRPMRNRAVPDAPATLDTPDTDNSNYRHLLQLIALLPQPDLQIVRAHLDGYSNREIAAITGLSATAVAMRLSRAKRRLRHQYEHSL